MSTGRKITLLVITFVVFVLIFYDIWICINYGAVSTISYVTWTSAKNYPIIPFAAGVLCGHLFWTQQVKLNKKKKKHG